MKFSSSLPSTLYNQENGSQRQEKRALLTNQRYLDQMAITSLLHIQPLHNFLQAYYVSVLIFLLSYPIFQFHFRFQSMNLSRFGLMKAHDMKIVIIFAWLSPEFQWDWHHFCDTKSRTHKTSFNQSQ